MKRIVKIFCLGSLFLLVGNGNSYAQIPELAQKTLNLGVMVQSKTVGIDLKLALKKKDNYSTLFDLDFVSLKHPKEQKVPNASNGGLIVYGKLNHFQTLRMGYGIKKTLGERVSRNTINVSAIAVLGLDIGILKPAYLEIAQPDTSPELSRVEAYDPSRHDRSNIIGSAGYFYGLNEIEIKPGAYGKVGLEFGWGNYRTSYIVVEVGATMDVFLSKIPIMHLAENKSAFSGFYISFALAKIY